MNDEVKTASYTSEFDIPSSIFCGFLFSDGIRAKPFLTKPDHNGWHLFCLFKNAGAGSAKINPRSKPLFQSLNSVNLTIPHIHMNLPARFFMPREDSQKRAVAQYFSKNRLLWKDIYDEDTHSMNLCFQISRRKKAILHVIDELARERTLDILDVGAGTGILLRDVLERGHHATAIDISFEMLQTARETVAEATIEKKDCVQADVEDLPFGRERFDVVTCLGVLSFVPSEKRAIREMQRVLKPGGILILTLPNILRINNFLDPCFFIKAAGLLRRKFTPADKNTQKALQGNEEQTFYTRKYFYNQLGPLFTSHGFFKTGTVSLGFGPLTFFKEPILAGRSFELISRSLEKMAGLKTLRFLNIFANHWVIYFRKLHHHNEINRQNEIKQIFH